MISGPQNNYNGRVSVLALVLGSLWALASPDSVILPSSQRTQVELGK
jgi:hypothetical protein